MGEVTREEQAVLRLLATFEQLGIPYAVGGSYASSLHGMPRSTNDMDVVADISPDDCDRLAEALSDEYYIDPEAAKDALARSASFNIIHLQTMFKMDVFAAAKDAFRLSLIQRRVSRPLGNRTFPVVSAEDIVLLKLDWYRVGGGVSDRQWRDVIEVLAAQSGRLDMEYLQREAERMGLGKLLDEALSGAASEDR